MVLRQFGGFRRLFLDMTEKGVNLRIFANELLEASKAPHSDRFLLLNHLFNSYVKSSGNTSNAFDDYSIIRICIILIIEVFYKTEDGSNWASDVMGLHIGYILKDFCMGF